MKLFEKLIIIIPMNRYRSNLAICQSVYGLWSMPLEADGLLLQRQRRNLRRRQCTGRTHSQDTNKQNSTEPTELNPGSRLSLVCSVLVWSRNSSLESRIECCLRLAGRLTRRPTDYVLEFVLCVSLPDCESKAKSFLAAVADSATNGIPRVERLSTCNEACNEVALAVLQG